MLNDAKTLIEYVENELRNALETNRLQLLSSKLWIMAYFKIVLFKAKKTHKPVNVSVKGGHWWVKPLISPDKSVFLYFPDFSVAKELMLQ